VKKRLLLIDFLKKLCYNNFVYKNAEVYSVSNEKLQSNKELGFLYKKCSIRPYVISQMALVPEYVEAIKAYTGEVNNQIVYDAVKSVYLKMLSEGKNTRTSTDVMNKVSKDVTGDSATWRKDIE